MKISRFRYLLLVVVLFAGCIKSDDGPVEEYVGVGDMLPVFTVGDPPGEYRSFDAMGKVTLITFFDPYCSDCKRELPVLQGVWENLGGEDVFEMVNIVRGMTLEGLSVAENSEAWLSMPCYPDPERRIYNLFATVTVPRIYLVDRTGVVREMWVEKIDLSPTDFLARIRSYVEMP